MVENFQTVRIAKIVEETPFLKTFYFNKRIQAEPGQFVMIWLPREDEKPFGFSYLGKETAVSVLRRGEFTKKLHELKKGALIGVRGPYGKGFETRGVKNAVIVGGGCGIAIIKPLAEKLKKEKANVTCIVGVKNRVNLFFERELKKFGNVIVYTDDGTAGKKGFATEGLKEILSRKKGKEEKQKIDCVYSCGPELMMLNVFKLCEEKKVKCQLALERYFKCAIGICGQCVIDGMLVCKDGPVFNEKQLRELKEFGAFARKKSGEKVQLHKLHEC